MDQHYRTWSDLLPRGLLMIGAGISMISQATAWNARRRPIWQWAFLGALGLVVLVTGVTFFGEAIKHRTLYESKLGL
ncbi:MAG: hypothetical protein JNL34_12405 [Anaerolineae bacterium]|nr:hypothetical protein [Anaerolineae bacterium]